MVLPKDIANALSGAWLLVNNTPTNLLGDLVPEEKVHLGNYPIGLLTYHATGFVSANLASSLPANRPSGPTFPPSAGNGTDAEYAIIGRETLAYAGPVSAKAGSTITNGTLVHGPLTVANIPSMVGTEQLRNYVVTEEDVACGEGKRKKTTLHIWRRDEEKKWQSNLYWEKVE